MKSRIIKDHLAYLWLSFFHCSCDGGAVGSMPVKFELEVEDAVSVQLRSNRKRSISFQNAGFLKDSSSAAMSEAEKFSRSVGTSIKAKAEG